MNDQIYQKIFNVLVNGVPENWNELLFYAEQHESSYSYEYFVKFEAEEYVQCYKLNGVAKSTIVKLFLEINKIIKPEYLELNEKNKWTNFTMKVTNSGDFVVDFDYSDLALNGYEYKHIWKYKYFGMIPSIENKAAYDAVLNFINTQN